ncbi:ankyrin repeat protein, putative [Trichomonas vaginalis G3]|uniref:Ankyrin repeat protein, putative n=1 Tax=Trichomonas vaginalis (strain ATCC PRA-98 / G3) TaxID=412133 RepID=A2GBA7_TRIV3|nr:protein ubiquitination [Trichomonas vaginalis G3]EAX85562.1 ankyrin repeat protein, putative [Trichomonas vaginalis G3]KAI5493752.1 protein ubiquitination [Trichomonas vaginalis G3]|eukprot:XP_001298492.1 ankyrin repeat protein [Trichomonas vaginalis G3]
MMTLPKFDLPIIHNSIIFNNLSLVQDLISCGIDPNMRNNYRDTPLHYACYYNSIDVVKFLLTLDGIDINAQNKVENTPLHEACRKNNQEIIKILLGFRTINISIRNNQSVTPSDMARDLEGPCHIISFKPIKSLYD